MLQMIVFIIFIIVMLSVVLVVVDELVLGVVKLKVNKGIKYYFIFGGIKIKYEFKILGYGDEKEKKQKKYKKYKRL